MKEIAKDILKKLPYIKKKYAELDEAWENADRLQCENERYCKAHVELTNQLDFVKFKLSEQDRLHDEVVEKQWEGIKETDFFFCRAPFENIEILPDGKVYTCCSATLKHDFYIGNLFEEPFEQVWNSDKAKKLRYSVTEGNFEYCTHLCHWKHDLNNKSINSPMTEVDKKPNFGVERYKRWQECESRSLPKYISLTCDESCNLRCESCRNEIKILSKQEADFLYEKLRDKLLPIVGECQIITFLDSGEIFASDAVSRLIKTLDKQNFPKLSTINIATNATLLNEKKWAEFSNLFEFNINLLVSIDAACQGTYEKLRRGAKWETLISNLEYIATLKKQKKISKVTFNFAIQKENFEQIEAFVEFATTMCADEIQFQRITNWGTFREEEFKDIDVFDLENSCFAKAESALKEAIEGEQNISIVQNII